MPSALARETAVGDNKTLVSRILFAEGASSSRVITSKSLVINREHLSKLK